jgi:hypothetical protein
MLLRSAGVASSSSSSGGGAAWAAHHAGVAQPAADILRQGIHTSGISLALLIPAVSATLSDPDPDSELVLVRVLLTWSNPTRVKGLTCPLKSPYSFCFF